MQFDVRLLVAGAVVVLVAGFGVGMGVSRQAPAPIDSLATSTAPTTPLQPATEPGGIVADRSTPGADVSRPAGVVPLEPEVVEAIGGVQGRGFVVPADSAPIVLPEQFELYPGTIGDPINVATQGVTKFRFPVGAEAVEVVQQSLTAPTGTTTTELIAYLDGALFAAGFNGSSRPITSGESGLAWSYRGSGGGYRVMDVMVFESPDPAVQGPIYLVSFG